MADEKKEKRTEADEKAAVKDAVAALTEIQTTLAALEAAEETRKSEIAQHGKATEETGRKHDALAAKVAELQKQLAEAVAQTNERLGKLSAPHQRGAGDEPAKSLGQAFIESGAYKAWKGSDGARKSDIYNHRGVIGPVPSVRGPQIVSAEAAGLKALLTTGAATRLIPPVRRDFVGVPAALTVRDLIPTATIGPSSGGIEYIREVGFHGGVELEIASMAWSGGILTINTAAAHGLRLGEWVRLANVDPAALDGIYVVHTLVDADTFTVRRGANPGAIVDPGDYVRLRVHGAAAGTAEGSAYPEATWEPQLIVAPDVSIGHQMPITERLREDDTRLAAYLDQRMEDGVLRREEIQIISGSGVGANFEGILTNALVPEWIWSNGPVGDTRVDAIRRAMTILRIAEYPGTGLLIAPEDNQEIDLQKGTDGHYLVLQVVSPGGMPTFFSLPRVETVALAAGTAIVGSFGLAARLWIRSEVQVRITDSHEAEFTSDILRIKASQREVFELNRPEAFCAVTFDSAPVAAT
jgi:hypothetical protein